MMLLSPSYRKNIEGFNVYLLEGVFACRDSGFVQQVFDEESDKGVLNNLNNH
jgi:hypothetical protein